MRECKRLLFSAWHVLREGGEGPILAGEIAGGPHRAIDPHYRVAEELVVRRLSPSSRKIEVDEAGDLLVSSDMLRSMGARSPVAARERPRAGRCYTHCGSWRTLQAIRRKMNAENAVEHTPNKRMKVERSQGRPEISENRPVGMPAMSCLAQAAPQLAAVRPAATATKSANQLPALIRRVIPRLRSAAG